MRLIQDLQEPDPYRDPTGANAAPLSPHESLDGADVRIRRVSQETTVGDLSKSCRCSAHQARNFSFSILTPSSPVWC
jgi:hypothetical protein